MGDPGSIPGSGRLPGGGHGSPLQSSYLVNPHGQRSLAGYSPQGLQELDTTEGLSTWGLTPRNSSQGFGCQRPTSEVSHCQNTSTKEPLTPASGSGPASCGVTSPFPWVFMCIRFCLWPPRLESLFPPVHWKSCNQVILVFNVRLPENSQSIFQIPSKRNLASGSEPSQ